MFDSPSKRTTKALKAITLALGLLTLLGLQSMCRADQTTRNTEDEETLAEQVNDPTATLDQFQVKDIYTPAEYGTNAQPNTLQIRPIFSIRGLSLVPLDQIIRPTIKVVTVPKGRGASTTTAYDDMQLFDLFVIPWPGSEETGLRWAVGPYFVLPTSTSEQTGNGAWQMGPAAGFAYDATPRLKIAGLLQQATSFAYTSSKSKPVTSLTFQPMISYELGHGWYLNSSDATWTFNLRHNTSTTIPISAGLGKVWKFNNDYSMDTAVSGEWMIYRQFADQTEQFTLNFTMTLLLPQLEL
jgi:hypothetical protein